jgi:hypothetical protein
MTNITKEQAKQILKDYGYFTDNLWHVSDVKDRYECEDDEAQDILNKALTNGATMEQIWMAIDEAIMAQQDLDTELEYILNNAPE